MFRLKTGSFRALFGLKLICVLCALSAYLLYVKGLHRYIYNFNSYELFVTSKEMLTLNNSQMGRSGNKSKLKFLIDTETCKILDVNPFDDSIKRLLNLHPRIKHCDERKKFTYIKDRTIYINKTRKPRDVTYCRVKPIFKKRPKWFEFGEQSAKFESSCPIKDEFLKTECYNSSGSIIAESFHMNFVHKILHNVSSTYKMMANSKDKERQLQGKHLQMSELPSGGQLNVLLIMLDSTSRINSLRYMPQTRRFLSETLGAVEMLGYNKVADNTRLNMVPFLTGEFAESQPCLNDKQGVDNCSFIWKKFSNKGYTTHFGEDWYQYGTFQYLLPGFKYKPTDYYDYPFYAASEQCRIPGTHICFHGKFSSEIVYDRMHQLASNLRGLPYFSLSTHSRHTHNFLSGLADIDNLTKNTLSKLFDNSLLNKTFLVVFGDHGMRFGNVRKSFIGQLEERLPLMFIYVPVWFRRKYNTYFRNLNINSRRLTTHFDMHSTLLHLLELDREMTNYRYGKGISLFNEIPYNRSCQDAGILSHWCTCNYHLRSKDNITITNILASALVNQINNLLKKFSQKCEKLEVMKIEYSLKLHSRDGKTDEHI